MLNAGRGNPNWIATTPREGFFLLGQFAMTESQRVMKKPARPRLACPRRRASPRGSTRGCEARRDARRRLPRGRWSPSRSRSSSFEPDAFVHELVDSIIGDNYPVPDRMLVHNEQIVHEYLMWAMCGEPRPPASSTSTPVEGGTAAMCYIFKSLKAQPAAEPGRHDRAGDADLHALSRDAAPRGLRPQGRQRSRRRRKNRFQFTEEELKKLEDPKIKAFFVVNPGNPTAVALDRETIGKIGQARQDQAAGSDAPDRRRLRDLRAGLPVAAGRAAAQHDRRLFLLEVFRLHRLAARRHRGPRGQHLRQDDRQAIPEELGRRWTSATARSRSSRASSSSSIASSPTAATSRLNHTAGLVAAAAGDDDAVLARSS